jgi:hypothetical protein
MEYKKFTLMAGNKTAPLIELDLATSFSTQLKLITGEDNTAIR